jgi:AraC-like DNA-binding protein
MFATLSISEICFRWGFNGSAHFSRAFKDRYGVSPRDYRKGQAAALGAATRPTSLEGVASAARGLADGRGEGGR